MIRLACIVLVFVAVMSVGSRTVEAKDVRLALLVANERGWGNEVRLKGAVKGDLVPLAKVLRKTMGFRVLSVRNGTADDVRRAFTQVANIFREGPRVTTFLFYYSGHASKQFFHLRNVNGVKKLGYREFLAFFLQLKVKRRIALLDACDSSIVIPAAAFYTSGRKPRFSVKGGRSPQILTLQSLLWERKRLISKGASFRKRKVDIQTIPMMTREPTSGLHIIASNGNAYYNNRQGSSVFTRYFIQGLRGRADNNKDGRVTLDELYNYARAKSKQESGQEMDRLVFFRGSYTLAPNYRSELLVSASLTGQLFVTIGEFTFKHNKSSRKPLLLPMMHGGGSLTIRKAKRCWTQKLFLPQGGRLVVSRYGKLTPCRQVQHAYAPKGDERVVLPSRGQRVIFRLKQLHSISLGGGMMHLGVSQIRTFSGHASFMYRWRGFLGVGLAYDIGQTDIDFVMHRVFLEIEPGYQFRFRAPVGIFLGAFARIGMVIVGLSTPLLSLAAGVGGQIAFSYYIDKRWGLRLGARVGFDYTRVADGTPFSLLWGVKLSAFYRF